MKSLPLVLCVLALLGAVVLAALCFQIGNSKKILETQLVAARASTAALDAQLAGAGEQNTSLAKRLTALDNDLGATKSRLTSTEAPTPSSPTNSRKRRISSPPTIRPSAPSVSKLSG